MKVEGQAAARGSIETVWDALHDAVILARAIPGCQHFEVSGPGLAQFVATTTLPAIGGTYAGKLAVAEQRRPSLLRLTAAATGDQGGITADVTLRLSAGPGGPTPLDPPDGAGPGGTTPLATLVSFEVNGTAAGSIAGVGTRLLASAARRLADEFFAALDEIVAAVVPEARESSTASVSAADAAGTEAPAEPVRAESPGPVARSSPAAGGRTALVAGTAIGLAGIIIGVLAGRRGRRGRGSNRARA